MRQQISFSSSSSLKKHQSIVEASFGTREGGIKRRREVTNFRSSSLFKKKTDPYVQRLEFPRQVGQHLWDPTRSPGFSSLSFPRGRKSKLLSS